MHIVPPAVLKLYLHDWNKNRFGPFDGIGAVCSFMRNHHISMSLAGDSLTLAAHCGIPCLDHVAYVIRTGNGTPVPASELHSFAREHPRTPLTKRFRAYRIAEGAKPEDFRKVPVAHTGKRKHGGYYRNIRTFAEIREAVGAEADGYDKLVRGSRKLHNLPDSWDDIWRHVDHSWKRHRQHQWKPRA